MLLITLATFCLLALGHHVRGQRKKLTRMSVTNARWVPLIGRRQVWRSEESDCVTIWGLMRVPLKVSRFYHSTSLQY